MKKISLFKVFSFLIIFVIILGTLSFFTYMGKESSNELTFRIPRAVKNYDKNDPCATIYSQVPYYNQLNKKERNSDTAQYCNAIINHNPNVKAEKSELGIDFEAKKEFYINSAENCKNDYEYYCTMTGVVNDLTGNHEYLDLHMIDTFYHGWLDHFMNKSYILKNNFLAGKEYTQRTVRMFKNIREFVPQYYPLYIDNTYWFTCVTPDEYVCTNEDNEYTYYTLTKINGNPISDFVYGDRLFGSKLKFDENKNFYRDEIIFNRTKGEPVTLTLTSPDGKTIEENMFLDITAEISYRLGRIFTKDKFSLLYEGQNDEGNIPYYIDEENNFSYIAIFNFDHRTSSYMDEFTNIMDNARINDNIIIDLRNNHIGNHYAAFKKFYPIIHNKDASLKYSYSITKDAAALFQIGAEMGIKDPNDTGVFKQDDKKYYVEYEIEAKGNPEIPDKNIYYIIDETIGECTEQYINLIKSNNLGTVIGTKSGGDGLQNGNVGFGLDYSGLIFGINVFEATNLDGSSNNLYGTSPDIIARGNREYFDTFIDLTKEKVNRQSFENRMKYDAALIKTVEEIKKSENKIDQ